MSSLKNLMIVAVLAAVGYGVYASLSRNTDANQSANSLQGWPAVPKVELPGAKSLGTPLAGTIPLGKPSSYPPLTPPGGAGASGAAAPPFTPGPAAVAPGSTPGVSPGVAPVVPYPSSSPPAAAQTTPSDAVRNLGPPPDVLAGGAAAPSAAPAADSLFQAKFSAFMQAVQKKLDEGKLAEAHLALSTLYGNPDLPAEQAKQITDLLDQLAGTVIYSRQSLLEKPYVVQPGDTIGKVAQQYNVPWELLARINGLLPPGPIKADDPLKSAPLPAGNELKVVRGPFDAVVSLSKHELALMLQGRYAGRFPIGVGRDQPSLEGTYTIRDKSLNPPYYGADGVNVNPGDPKNPLGGAWIGLTDRIGIHGTNSPQGIGRDDNRGSICVGDRDLHDLYGIITVGSRVTVQR
jgi:LysM repeat protein